MTNLEQARKRLEEKSLYYMSGLNLYKAFRCPECIRNIESMRKKDGFYQCQCGVELVKNEMVEKTEERREW
jgi:hypothetical protein